MNYEDIKKRTDEAVEKKKKLDAETRILYALLRKHCPHETLLEAPYSPSSEWFSASEPMRACEDCGVEEWSWNFKFLKGRAYPVKRHDIIANRRGTLALFNNKGVIMVGPLGLAVTNDSILEADNITESKTCKDT